MKFYDNLLHSIRKSLRLKLIIAFLLAIFIPSIIIGISIWHNTNQIKNQAQEKVKMDLNSAEEIYNQKLQQIKYAIDFTASTNELYNAFQLRDDLKLNEILNNTLSSINLDFLILLNDKSDVIFRANNPNNKKGNFASNPMVLQALQGRTVANTTIINIEDLINEHYIGTGNYNTLAEQVEMEIKYTAKAKQTARKIEHNGMALVSAVPIYDKGGEIIGTLYGGYLLNRNFEIVDNIKKTLYGGTRYKGKEIGTATIFQDGLRISTNVRTKEGQRAIGTFLSEEVYDAVLGEGESWYSRAWVVNAWYITAYKPIKDINSRRIGVLYVGILEKPYQEAILGNVLLFVGVMILGAILTILMALWMAKRITDPINKLKNLITGIAKGDFNQDIVITSEDEIGEVMRASLEVLNNIIGRNESIIKAIVDPMFTVDKDRNITFFNEAIEKLTGYSQEEVLGKNCASILKSNICNNNCPVRLAQINAKPIYNQKSHLTKKDGTKVPSSVSAAVLKNLQGKEIGAIEIIRDITLTTHIENQIVQIVKQLNNSIGDITSAIDEQITDVEEHTIMLSEVTVTMEEIAATARQIAEHTDSVVRVAEETLIASSSGDSAVKSTIIGITQTREKVQSIAEKMLVLGQYSTQIGGIVEIINEISENINLLALNAAIEAVGAGESGKRFAIVATEMRKLAEKTIDSTKRIKNLIDEIQSSTNTTIMVTEEATKHSDQGAKLAQTAGNALNTTIEAVDATTRAAQEIGISTQQQKTATEALAYKVVSMSNFANQILTIAQKTMPALNHLRELNNELQKLVEEIAK